MQSEFHITEPQHKDFKKKVLQSVSPFDYILFFALLFISVAGIFFTDNLYSGGTDVIISVNNEPQYKLSLSIDRTVETEGVIVEIRNNRVGIRNADCPNKLCMAQGWIDRGALICLPNRVVVTITGSEGKYRDVDAVTG